MNEDTNSLAEKPYDKLGEATPTFGNPYPNIRENGDDSMRICFDVPREHAMQIRMVNLDVGILTASLAMFVKFLRDQCVRNNWSMVDRNRLIALVEERCTPKTEVKVAPEAVKLFGQATKRGKKKAA